MQNVRTPPFARLLITPVARVWYLRGTLMLSRQIHGSVTVYRQTGAIK